jgi:hypothetical protein
VHHPGDVGTDDLALPRQALDEGRAARRRRAHRRLDRCGQRRPGVGVRRGRRLPADPQAPGGCRGARHHPGRRRRPARLRARDVRQPRGQLDRRGGVRGGPRGVLRHDVGRRRPGARLRLPLLPERARGDAHPLDLPAVHLDQPGRLRRGLQRAEGDGPPGQPGARHRHEPHAHGVVLRAEGAAVLRDRLPAARCRRMGPLLRRQRHRRLPRVGPRDRARPRGGPALAQVRQRDHRAAPRQGRPHRRLHGRRRDPGPVRRVGPRRPPAGPGHADPGTGGRLHGERLRPDAPPGLRRAAADAGRRRAHRPRPRRITAA